MEPRKLLAALVGFEPIPTTNSSNEVVWEVLSEQELNRSQGVNRIHANSFSAFQLDLATIKQQLSRAPLEYTTTNQLDDAVVITVPAPNASLNEFAVVEAPVMASSLSAKYPGIKTYRGIGVSDPSANIRLDISQHGFHAMVSNGNGNDYFVDPYFHLDDQIYMSYFISDSVHEPFNAIQHDLGSQASPSSSKNSGSSSIEPANGLVSGSPESGLESNHGDQLRTYELAVAATGEYTNYFGGTVADGLAAIVTLVNRANLIFERDVAVRMELIANNDSLIYTNPNTDPYPSRFTLHVDNQENIDNVIGSANYDLGHALSYDENGGSGYAPNFASVAVDGEKAKTSYYSPQPEGTTSFLRSARIFGSMFGASSTHNGRSGTCQTSRVPESAYEPGSGSTLMSLIGSCGYDNVQRVADPYFHSASIDQIRTYISSGVANTSATISSTGNSIPIVDAGADYTIPTGTPFELTGTASDADPSDLLTYSWEQRNLGPAKFLDSSDNGESPHIRTLNPSTAATRSIPALEDLVINSASTANDVPTASWDTLDFRLVVRDNVSGGGALGFDDMKLSVVDTGGPFQITSQNQSVRWFAGETETITWDVAGTDTNGIDVSEVDILFATDGLNFDQVLASNVPNDGTQNVIVPNELAREARIMVKAVGNIFFDINDSIITIDEDRHQYSSSGDQLISSSSSVVTTSAIEVTDGGTITDLDLQIEVSHLEVGDLRATVTSPNGTVVEFFPRTIVFGRNLNNTYFDDDAAISIRDDYAPWVGKYRPEESLEVFNGEELSGEWTLEIYNRSGQGGRLDSWSIFAAFDSDPLPITQVEDINNSDNVVEENATVGSTVGITAYANDPNPQDDVTYSLTDDAGGKFAIDSISGIVTTAESLDFETDSSHEITVEAMSSDGSTSTRPFMILVNNIDDAIVTTRQLYYRGSDLDDGALGGLVPDKSFLEPGNTATFENYSSYSRGINSIVIEVNDLNVVPTLATLGDFMEFHVGNSNETSTWSIAAAPSELVYLPNAEGTMDRIFVNWDDNAIQNTWLEIKVLANANTGLPSEDVFYFGNAVGETGNDASNAIVNLIDVALTRTNQTGFNVANIDDPYDFNRDQRVNLQDVAIARTHQSGFSPLILITPNNDSARDSNDPKGKQAGIKSAGLLIGLSTDTNRNKTTSTDDVFARKFVTKANFVLAGDIRLPNSEAETRFESTSKVDDNAIEASDFDLAEFSIHEEVAENVFNQFK